MGLVAVMPVPTITVLVWVCLVSWLWCRRVVSGCRSIMWCWLMVYSMLGWLVYWFFLFVRWPAWLVVVVVVTFRGVISIQMLVRVMRVRVRAVVIQEVVFVRGL